MRAVYLLFCIWEAGRKGLSSSGNLSDSPVLVQRWPGGILLQGACLQASDVWKVCGYSEWGCGRNGRLRQGRSVS